MKNEFLKNEIKSENTAKSYMTIFKKAEEYEDIVNKGMEDWDREDILDFLALDSTLKLNTLTAKWSLLKKYMNYVGNEVAIDKDDLENIEHRTMEYISLKEVKEIVGQLKNNIDKAVILLLRYGIKGKGFEEIINLKVEDIEGNLIRLDNRVVILDDFTADIVQNAIKERGYHMTIKEGKKSTYNYYHYNMDSVYLWKNRKNKYNNNGLNPMKENACKDKLCRLFKMVGRTDIDATSLVTSWVVDKVIEFEKEVGIKLTESQMKPFIEKLGVTVNVYSCFSLKNSIDK